MGDLNSRIGNYNSSSVHPRNARDQTINSKGRKLINVMEAFELNVFNGCTNSDPHGDFYFVNKNGSS
jgi:hypothetical protein